MDELNKEQREVFNYIVSYKGNNDGNSPSYQKIGDYVGHAKSYINKIIGELKSLGYLRDRPGIYVVGGEWTYDKG